MQVVINTHHHYPQYSEMYEFVLEISEITLIKQIIKH